MMQPTDSFAAVAAFHTNRLELFYKAMSESLSLNPMVLQGTRIRGKGNPGIVDLRFAVIEDNLDQAGFCTLMCIDMGEDGNELTIRVPLLNLSSTDPFTHTTETGVVYELQAVGRLSDLIKPPTLPAFLERYRVLTESLEN